MKQKLYLLLLAALPVTQKLIAQKNSLATITVANKSALSFKEKVVELPWRNIEKLKGSMDTSKLIVLDANTKKQLPFQYETKGTDSIQNLLVQVSLKPMQTKQILLQYGTRAAFATKTYGRYIPERKEDFAWENDKIAFRMYGKELEKTPKENAYGLDVWVKRTDRMILNERYKRMEYHIDHGDGMDYYHVGFSLGAGNSAPYVNDSIYYSKNYVGHKTLDNGPLRTSFQLAYDAWDVAGNSVKATKTFSLDAGDQLSKVQVQYSYGGDANLPLVVGIIKRKEQGLMYLNEQDGIMGYWEPTHGADGTTGVGTIFAQPATSMSITAKHLLAKSEANNKLPFVYYTGAAWDRAGAITNAEQWFAYLKQFKAALQHPITVQ